MKKLSVWENKAGWGFIGITSGFIFGLSCIFILNYARDPTIYSSWSSMLKALWLELIFALILGWLIGGQSAWFVYSSTSSKTPEIFRKSSKSIARLSFIFVYIMASAYYLLTGPDQKAHPLVFWLAGVVGLLVSGKIGSTIGFFLLKGAED